MVQHSCWRSRCCGVLAAAALLAPSVPATAQTATAPPVARQPIAAQRPALSPQLPGSTQGVIFGDVIGRTIGDFKRLPSRDTLAWLGIGAAIALAAHPADQSSSRGLGGSLTADRTFEAGEILGGAIFQFAGSAATYLTGRAVGSSRITAVGADLLRAQVLAQTVTTAMKYAVQRDRPDGTQYSFPSGHSSVSFASATVLQRHLGWKVGALAYGAATYVAVSRIQEERHFLSDVAFGAAVGIVAGRAVTIDVGDKHFALSPTVTRGGGGVSFSLVSD
jgi:membrane-associated phospholipid phosphatase